MYLEDLGTLSSRDWVSANETWVSAEDQIRDSYARRPQDSARYSWSTPGHVFAQQERERQVLKLLRQHGLMPLSARRILEVGCGTGAWLRQLVEWGAEPEGLAGIDLLSRPLNGARRRVAAGVKLYRASAANLPFAAQSFDIVLQATAFSSMRDPALRARVAAEILRVLKPGGAVLWYDFHMNNPRNRDVVAMKRPEITRLFPGCRISLTRTCLAPPLMRPVSRRSWVAAYLLSRVPLLCTHYLGTISPSSQPPAAPDQDYHSSLVRRP